MVKSLHRRWGTNDILEVEDFVKLPFLKEHVLNTGGHAFTNSPMYLTYQVSLTLNIEVLDTSSIYLEALVSRDNYRSIFE